MTTLNENKMIAEFMGYNLEVVNDEVYFTLDDMLETLSDEELHYHTDWNWLIGVVDKIESLGYDVQIILDYCTITNGDYSEITQIGGNKIHNVYNACVEFIKWYTHTKNN